MFKLFFDAAFVQLAKDVQSGKELSFRTIKINRRHRLPAMHFFRNNQTQNDPDWRSITSRLEFSLYIRKKHIPIDNLIKIAFDQHLNTATTVSLPTKFRSRVKPRISSLHLPAKCLNKEFRQLPIEQSVQSLQDSGNTRSLERKATARYREIALRLARSEEHQQINWKCQFFSCGLLSKPILCQIK